jgi:hypothetical protein
MPWYHDVELSFHAVAKVGVTACLVMNIKACPQQNLQEFL